MACHIQSLFEATIILFVELFYYLPNSTTSEDPCGFGFLLKALLVLSRVPDHRPTIGLYRGMLKMLSLRACSFVEFLLEFMLEAFEEFLNIVPMNFSNAPQPIGVGYSFVLYFDLTG